MIRSLRRGTFNILLAVLLLAGLIVGPLRGSESGDYSRSYRHSFPLKAGDSLRLANLAGNVELLPGKGGELVVEATIHGAAQDAAETRKIVDRLAWTESHDRKGRAEWALSYPVGDYHGFAYPRGEQSGWWDENRTQTEYLGKRVTIYSRQRADAPVLYADLKIEIPGDGRLALRNGAGAIKGSKLAGDLAIDTGSGDVAIAVFDGSLTIDTGSGDVALGSISADCSVDTGSGNIRIQSLRGNAKLDTGSGDVEVKEARGQSFIADTGSGGIKLSGGAVASLMVDTGSGDIRIEGVDMENFKGDTGSGDVVIRTDLLKTKAIVVDTGSGNVRILAGKDASFDLDADQGSGDLVVGYDDAVYKKKGREINGARRGDGKTRIHVETGSGDCVIKPEA